MHLTSLSNPAPLRAGSRLVALDELKGYALVLVLLYHLGGIFGWRNWLHGEVGVDVFLIISGFALTLNAAHLTPREFICRRVLRIFPAYWIAFILFALLQESVFKVPVSGTSITLHLFALHGFASPVYFTEINDSFWFISLIVLLYGIFLALRKHLDDPGYVIGVGALATAAAVILYRAAGHDGGVIHLAVRIPSFFIGIVAAQLLTRPETHLKASAPLAGGFLALLWVGWNYGIIPYYAFAGVTMTAAFLFVTRALNHLPEVKATRRALAFLGVYSYEIFLFHQPIIRDYNRVAVERLLGGATPATWQLAIGVIVGLVLTLALSIGIHRLTDRIFTSLRRPSAPLEPARVPIRLA